ncbi:hypothetical protein Tco_0711411 [Tanacetum coccineum]
MARKGVRLGYAATPRLTLFITLVDTQAFFFLFNWEVQATGLNRATGCGGMERGFLSQKRSRGGRGVKEKSLNRNSTNTSSGIGVSTKSDDTMNEDTRVVASTVKEGVTPSVVDMMVEKEKISSLEDTTVSESFPTLTMPVNTTAGDAPDKSSYANITGKPSGKKVNVLTLFTPEGNGIDVVILVDSIRAISECFANTTYGFFFSMDGLDAMLENGPWFIRNNLLILKKWHPDENLLKEDVSWSSYARVMIKLRADMELKDNMVVAMPKITRVGHYTCAGEKKTVKKPSQTSRGIPSTASSSGNKKKGAQPIIEVSNLNPFDVLNSVDNDVKFGTNRGTTNLVNNGATSSGSSFMNVDNSSSGTTPIIKKIGKFEDLLTSGQAILVDKAGNPLKKVEFLGEYDSEDEVASVDNDMARSMAYERVGFGTQSLLEQWRDSYGNGDYDDDPYDDDMYQGQDLSHELQAICDNLDIRF